MYTDKFAMRIATPVPGVFAEGEDGSAVGAPVDWLFATIEAEGNPHERPQEQHKQQQTHCVRSLARLEPHFRPDHLVTVSVEKKHSDDMMCYVNSLFQYQFLPFLTNINTKTRNRFFSLSVQKH